jgi:chorismate mutase/prephenate dehydratase
MSLEDLRKRINALDDALVELLDQRARAVSEAFEIKRKEGLPLHDPKREMHVLDRVERKMATRKAPSFPVAGVRPVFREILSACLSVTDELKVAYLGPPGTFSHMAAQSAFGLGAQYVQSATIPGVFDAVAGKAADCGVVPIENSTEGGVSFTLDSLIDSDVVIRQELVLDITQCLLGHENDLGTIDRVYSHPQAIAQCRKWLARNLPTAQLVVSNSTATAAREAIADPSAAAIGSRLAGQVHGLRVIRESIQDRSDNSTRFVVIDRSDASPTGDDKTSLLFSTPHEEGALKRVLEILYEEGINMTRIESRPRPGAQRWEYVFFTDVEGHRAEPAVGRALARLAETCGFVKVLGSYPRAK